MTHAYTATVLWQRGEQPFTDRRYSRAHEWRFDGGVTVPASSSPSVVKVPLSREDAVDPEEAFVAALASCHMLFFLDFAARAGFRIDEYRDEASGVMGKRADGRMFVAKVTLSPHIAFSGDKRPSESEIAELHHRSHEACFIANSVTTEIEIASVPPVSA
jgi:organic hydroperoxide reductase OsmC/OhrA